MLTQEKLTHIVAVALLLIAVEVTAVAGYFGITGKKDFAVVSIVPDVNLSPPPPPQFVAINVGEIDTTPNIYAHPVLEFEVLYPQSWYPVLEISPYGPFEFSNEIPDKKGQSVSLSRGSKVALLKTNDCNDSGGWKEASFDGHVFAEKTICKDGFQITLTSSKKNVTTGGANILDFIASTFQMMDTDDPRLLRNWQTYRNRKYGFELKYPNEWSYEEHTLMDIDGTSGFSLDFDGVVVLSGFPGSLEDELQYIDGINEKSTIRINGIEMIKIPQGGEFGGWRSDYRLVFQKDGLVYSFSEGFGADFGDKPKIEALYSTFKFLK